MKPWRKLYSSILESERFMDVPLEGKVLFFLLVAAQDDTGYYPWERMKVRSLVATCGWSETQARQHAEALVTGGMATWEGGGIVLRNGAALNGQNRTDRQPLLYQRSTTDIPVTDTDIPVVNPEREGEGDTEREIERTPIVPLKGDAQRQRKKRVQPALTTRTGVELLAMLSEEEAVDIASRFAGVDLPWEAGKCVEWHNARGGSGNWKLALKNWLDKWLEKQQTMHERSNNGRTHKDAVDPLSASEYEAAAREQAESSARRGVLHLLR